MTFPFVSILLPIRNEESSIESCLNAIFIQDYPKGYYEVIVAIGESTDCTKSIVEGLQETHSNLLLIENPGKIVPTGLNRALLCARGDIVVRVDGHTIIAPDYVKECVLALQRSDADNVGGKMNAEGGGRFGRAVAISTSSPFGVGSARFHYSSKEEWVDTVYLGAWRREVFDHIGLFDEEMIRDQDDEFNYRLREFGGKILLSPKIKSRYTVRSTPVKLFKQYFQYGYWKVRVLQKHPLQMSLRQFVPPLFVFSLIISLIMSFISPLGNILLALVAGLYLFANVSVSLFTAYKHGWKYLHLFPLVYGILHFSYGTGFMVGLVRFIKRWTDKKGLVPRMKPTDGSIDILM